MEYGVVKSQLIEAKLQLWNYHNIQYLDKLSADCVTKPHVQDLEDLKIPKQNKVLNGAKGMMNYYNVNFLVHCLHSRPSKDRKKPL